MPLEGFVANLLNKYLGKYIENLDAEQLKISVFRGNVDLKDLKVKADALNELLELPIVVKSGSVGKITLHANWRALGSQPVQVELDSICVVAGPQTHPSLSTEEELQRAIRQKLQDLQLDEDVVLGLKDIAKAVEEEDRGGYLAKLATAIVDNLQVSVRNVHVRYEGASTEHEGMAFPSYALGVCLGELSAYTTDANWARAFVAGAKSVFKEMKLSDFFVYLEESPSSLASKPAALIDVFRRRTEQPNSMQYLLRPVSGRTRLMFHKEDVSPQAKLQCSLQSFDICLLDRQYHTLLSFTNAMYRGQETIAKEIAANKPKFDRGSKTDMTAYVALYKRKLNADWLPELGAEERQQMEQMEQRLDYEDVSRYRFVAVAELRRELNGKPVTLRQAPKKKGFISRWFGGGGGGGSGSAAENKTPGIELSEADRQQLYAAIEYDPKQAAVARKTTRPADFVLVDISFQLDQGQLSLWETEERKSPSTPVSRELTRLSFVETTVDIVTRPSSTSVVASLGAIRLSDNSTRDTLYPELIMVNADDGGAKRTAGQDRKRALAIVRYEARSFAERVEGMPFTESTSLNVELLQRSTIVVNHMWTNRLISFFSSEVLEIDILDSFVEYAADRLQELRKDITATSRGDKEQAPYAPLSFSVSFAAPTIIVPQDPRSRDPSNALLVVDMGQLEVSSRQPEHRDLARLSQRLGEVAQKLSSMDAASGKALLRESLPAMRKMLAQLLPLPQELEECYDKYSVRLSQFQVFAAAGQWRAQDTVASRSSSLVHVLRPVRTEMEIQCSVLPALSEVVPWVKIQARLEEAHVALTPEATHRLLAVFEVLSQIGSSSTPSPSAVTSLQPKEEKPSLQQQGVNMERLFQRLGFSESSDKVISMDELSLQMDPVSRRLLVGQIIPDENGRVAVRELVRRWHLRQHLRKMRQVVDATVDLSKLRLTLFPSKDAQSSASLTAHSRLSAEYHGYTFDNTLFLAVHDFDVVDSPSSGADGARQAVPQASRFPNLVSVSSLFPIDKGSSGNGDRNGGFLRVSIHMLDRESPDFASAQVETDIEVEAGSLSFFLEPSRLLRVSRLVLEHLPSSSPSRSSLPSSSSNTSIAGVPGRVHHTARGGEVGGAGSAAVRFQGSIDSMRAVLLVGDHELASVSAEKLSLGGSMHQGGHTKAWAQLSDVVVEDRSSAVTKYRYMVRRKELAEEAGEGKEREGNQRARATETATKVLLRVEFASFVPSASDYPGYPSLLRGNFRGLRVVVLQRFVSELILFFTQGDMAKLTALLSAASSDSEAAGAITAAKPERERDDGTRYPTRVEFDVSDICLLVPEASSSDSHLRVAIERLEVRSSVQNDLARCAKGWGVHAASRPNQPSQDPNVHYLASSEYANYTAVMSAFVVESYIAGQPRTSSAATKALYTTGMLMQLGQITARVDVLDPLANLTTVELSIGEVVGNFQKEQYVMLMRLTAAGGNMQEDTVVLQPSVDLEAARASRGAASTRKSSTAAVLPPAGPSSSRMLVRASMPRLSLVIVGHGGAAGGQSQMAPMTRLDVQELRLDLDQDTNAQRLEQVVNVLCSLRSLNVSDLCTKNTRYPNLLATRGEDSSAGKTSFLSVRVRDVTDLKLSDNASGPASAHAGDKARIGGLTEVSVDVMPSDVVINRPWIDSMVEFFSQPMDIQAAVKQQQLESHVAQQLRHLSRVHGSSSEHRSEEAQAAVAKMVSSGYKPLSLSLSMRAPTVVVPEDPTSTSPSSNILVIDSGRFNVSTKHADSTQLVSFQREASEQTEFKLSSAARQALKSLLDQEARESSARSLDDEQHRRRFRGVAYDEFQLRGGDLCVFLTNGVWNRTPSGGSEAPSTKTKDTSGSVDASRTELFRSDALQVSVLKPIIPDPGWLPALWVDAQLPAIDLTLNAHTAQRLVSVVEGVSGARGSAGDGGSDSPSRERDITLSELLAYLQVKKSAKSERVSINVLAKKLGVATTETLLRYLDVDSHGTFLVSQLVRILEEKQHALKLIHNLRTSATISRVTIRLDWMADPSGGKNAGASPSPRAQQLQISLSDLCAVHDIFTFDTRLLVKFGSFDAVDTVEGKPFSSSFPALARTTPSTDVPSVALQHGLLAATRGREDTADRDRESTFLFLALHTLAKGSPDYVNELIDTDIELVAGSVQLTLDPKRLLWLTESVTHFMPSGTVKKQEGTPKPLTASSSSLSIDSSLPLHKKLRLKASAGGVVALLVLEEHPLAQLQLRHAVLEASALSNGTLELETRLHHASVEDESLGGERSSYKYMVETLIEPHLPSAAKTGVVTKEASAPLLWLKYCTYDVASDDYPGWPSLLSGHFQGLRVVYLARFVDGVQAFAKDPYLAEISNVIDQLSSKQQETEQRQPSVDARAVPMQLSFEINNVQLVVPESSRSPNRSMALMTALQVKSCVEDGVPQRLKELDASEDRKQALLRLAADSGRVRNPDNRPDLTVLRDSQYPCYRVSMKGLIISSVVQSRSGSGHAVAREMARIGPVAARLDQLVLGGASTVTSLQLDLGLVTVSQRQEQFLLLLRTFGSEAGNLSETNPLVRDLVARRERSLVLERAELTRRNAPQQPAPLRKGEAENRGTQVFVMSAAIGSLVAEIHEDVSSDPQLPRQDDHSIARLEGASVSLSLDQTVTPGARDSILVAHLKSLSLIDLLSSAGIQFRRSLVVPEPAQRGGDTTWGLSARVCTHEDKLPQTESATASVADVDLNNIRISVTPALVRLVEFFSAQPDLEARDEAAVVLADDGMAPAVEVEEQTTVVGAESAETSKLAARSMSLRVRLRNGQFVLIEDPSKAHSVALAFNCDADGAVQLAADGSSEMTVEASKSSVQRIHVDAEQYNSLHALLGQVAVKGLPHPRVLVDSFRMQLLARNYSCKLVSSSASQPSSIVWIDMDPITAQMSYADYSVLMSGLDLVQTELLSHTHRTGMSAERAGGDDDELTSVERRVEKALAVAELPGRTRTREGQRVSSDSGKQRRNGNHDLQELPFAGQELRVRLRGLNFTLVNDVMRYATPVLRARVAGPDAQLTHDERRGVSSIVSGAESSATVGSFTRSLSSLVAGQPLDMYKAVPGAALFSLHCFASQRRGEITLQLSLDYFDQRTVSWDSVVRPWIASARLWQSMGSLDRTPPAALIQAPPERLGAVDVSGASAAAVGSEGGSIEEKDDADSDDDSEETQDIMSPLHSMAQLDVEAETPLGVNVTHAMIARVLDSLRQIHRAEEKRQLVQKQRQERLSLKQQGKEQMAPTASAAATVAAAAAAAQADVQEAEQLRSPLVLENKTEFALRVIHPLVQPRRPGDVEKDGSVPFVDMAPNSSLPFPSDDLEEASMYEAQLRLHDARNGAAISRDVMRCALTSQGCRVHSLNLAGAARSLHFQSTTEVAVELRVRADEGGVATLSVHSTVGVRNHCGTPLRFRLGYDGALPQGEAPFEGQAKPGESAWFPLCSRVPVSGFHLLVVQQRQQQWSDALPLDFGVGDAGATSPSQKRSSKAQGGAGGDGGDESGPSILSTVVSNIPFRQRKESQWARVQCGQGTFLSVQRDEIEGITSLRVRPPMILENLLTMPARFRLRYGQDASGAALQLAGGEVERGELSQVFDVDMRRAHDQSLQLSVSLPQLGGTGWSDWVPLRESKSLVSGLLGQHRQIEVDSESELVTDKYVAQATVRDREGRSLHISVEAVYRGDAPRDVLQLVLYVPFWLFDLTTLNLGWSVDGQTMPPPQNVSLRGLESALARRSVDQKELIGACMFSLAPGYKQDNIVVRTPSSEWSNEFSLGVLGETRQLEIRDRQRGRLYAVSAHTRAGSGIFRRTRMVTLHHRFVFTNGFECPLVLWQVGASSSTQFRLQPGEAVPFHWPDASKSRLVSFLPEAWSDSEWSGGISLEALGEVVVAFVPRHADAKQQQQQQQRARPDIALPFHFALVELRLHEFTTYAKFKDCPRYMVPYRVENRTVREVVRVRQAPAEDVNGQSTHVRPFIRLMPYSSAPFAWYEPTRDGPPKLELCVVGSDMQSSFSWDELDQITGDVQLELQAQPPRRPQSTKVFMYTVSDGPTKVLVVSDFPNPDLRDPVQRAEVLEMTFRGMWQQLIELRRGMRAESALLPAEESAASGTAPGRVGRPQDIPDSQAVLQLDVSEGRGTRGETVYLTLDYRGQRANCHAANVESGRVKWGERIRFDALAAHAGDSVVLSLWEKRTFWKDEKLGEGRLDLAELTHHMPQERQITLYRPNAGGASSKSREIMCIVQTRAWWIPMETGSYRQRVQVSLHSEVSERGRVARILDHKLRRQQKLATHARQLSERGGSRSGALGKRGKSAKETAKPRKQQPDTSTDWDRISQALSVAAQSDAIAESEVMIEMISERGLSELVSKWRQNHQPKGEEWEWTRVVCTVSHSKKATQQQPQQQQGAHELQHMDAAQFREFGAGSVVLMHNSEALLGASDQLVTFRFFLPTSEFQAEGGEQEAQLVLCVFLELHKTIPKGEQVRQLPSVAPEYHLLGTVVIPLRNVRELSQLRKQSVEQKEERKSGKAAVRGRRREIELAMVDSQWYPVDLAPFATRLATGGVSSKGMGGAARPALQLNVRRASAPPFAARTLVTSLLSLVGVQLSLIASEQREVLRVELLDALLGLEESATHTGLQLVLEDVHVINPQPRAQFTQVIGCTPLGSGEPRQPVLQLSISKARGSSARFGARLEDVPYADDQSELVQGSSALRESAQGASARAGKVQRLKDRDAAEAAQHMHVYHYVSLLVQALDVEIEEPLVWRLVAFFGDFDFNYSSGRLRTEPERLMRVEKTSRECEQELEALVQRRPLRVTVPQDQLGRVYVGVLQLQPLYLRLSFEAQPDLRQSRAYNPLDMVFNIASSGLGSVSEAPLKFRGLAVTDAFGTPETLQQVVIHHYRSQLLRMSLRLAGSISVLGDPLNLATSLGSGVRDFFYEPARGLVQSPAAFAAGLQRGSMSLVRNTLGGLTHSASLIVSSLAKATGTLGKGLSMLSMDEEFVRRNDEKKIGSLSEGIKSGVIGLGQGFVSGVSGVFTSPYKGAQEGGVGGFLKGLGKGAVGVVAKPTSGIVNFASDTLAGIGSIGKRSAQKLQASPSQQKPQ